MDIVATMAGLLKRANTSEQELRQFRAELDTAAGKLPSQFYDGCQQMSNEATAIMKRLHKLQENVRKVSLEKTAGA